MLKFELPWPDPALAPNRKNGRHWSTVHTIKNQALLTGKSAAMMQMIATGYKPPESKLPVVMTFCAPDKRHRDLDNLLASEKNYLDGVAQALGVDDKMFEPITLKRGDVVKGGCVIVEIG